MAAQSERTPADVTQPAPASPAAKAQTPGAPTLLPAPPQPGRALTVAQRLFQEGFVFDFFQAMRLLEKLQPDRLPVTRAPSPDREVVRLRPRQTLEFPASTVHEILPPASMDILPQPGALLPVPVPTMLVNFMGLTGPSGVLPRHYTEMLLRLERDLRHGEKYALRDWLDLFNHRLTSLFFRAWEKYRFYIPYERAEYENLNPDPFTLALFSLVGLGLPALRNRLRVSYRPAPRQEQVLGKIEDLALLRFGGFLAHRPRNTISLQVLLRHYLQVPVEVQQFQGQWLRLEPDNQSSLGRFGKNNGMGVNALIGDRVWDVQSKIRIRVGPLPYDRFVEFLPDPSPVPQRKALFLLAHLVRLYVGPEIDLEVQLVLQAEEVPMCRMGRGAVPIGSRIGWNSWSRRKPRPSDADEPVFQIRERVFLHPQK